MTSRFFGRNTGGAGAGADRDREREREQRDRFDGNQDSLLGGGGGRGGGGGGGSGAVSGRGSYGATPRTQTPPVPPPKGELILKTNHLTPNGLKVLIYAQELLNEDPEVFDLQSGFRIQKVNLGAKEHQTRDFLALNPNGRIPVLIDKLREDFPIFESAAILLYLEQFDRRKSFTYDQREHPKEYSSMLQWVLWAHGNLGPTQTQAHYFRHYCFDDVPFAKQKYQEETQRLYTVMNDVLENRPWLLEKYTIADINAYPWVRLHRRAGIDSLEHRWPKLQEWLERMGTRAAVHRAIQQAKDIGEDERSSMNVY